MSAGFYLQKHLYEPEGLTSLPKALRTTAGNSAAVCADGFKLSSATYIRSSLCHSSGKLRISFGISYGSLAAHNHSIKEVLALGIVCISLRERSKLGLCLLYDTLVSDGKYLGVIYRNVSYAVIKVVTRSEHTVVYGSLCLTGHIGRSKLACCFTFPILVHLRKSFLGVLRYVEGVSHAGCHGVEFSLKPLEGVFGENLTSSRRLGSRTYDKLVFSYRYRYMLKNVLECLCPSGYDRLALRSLI